MNSAVIRAGGTGLLCLGLTFVTPLTAAVSTGGVFSLDSSLVSAASQSATDGSRFSLRGSIGEGFCPATSKSEPLKVAFKRIYSGLLGVPPLVDPTKTNLMILNDGTIQIAIPAGAFAQPYEPMVEVDPLSFPIEGDPSMLPDASQKLADEFGAESDRPLAIYELRFLLGDGTLFSGDMPQPGNSSMMFTVAGNTGDVWVYHLNETGKMWMKASPVSTSSPINFLFNRAGITAVFQLQQTLTAAGVVYAYPVPWRPNFNNPALYGTPQDGITFAGLPAAGVIGIYSLAGESIRDIVIPPGALKLAWDGKTGSGSDVASGVYIWSVQSADGNRTTGKLMIIR